MYSTLIVTRGPFNVRWCPPDRKRCIGDLFEMAAISLASCALPLALALAPPVLRFTDCKTGREIVLVGCMHGNPTSIQLTESVLRETATKLTRTPRGLRWVRTGYAYQPPLSTY